MQDEENSLKGEEYQGTLVTDAVIAFKRDEYQEALMKDEVNNLKGDENQGNFMKKVENNLWENKHIAHIKDVKDNLKGY